MSKFKSPRVIMITGAAGYIGTMLCDQFSKSPDLEMIVAVDMAPMPELLRENKKIVWITSNLYQNVWKIPALINKPEVVIHAAWQTREPYGRVELQNELNLTSSREVFEFAFKNQFVKKLIFLSDASVYGAFPDNNLEHFFSETDKLKELDTLSCQQKKEAERLLLDLYNMCNEAKQVFVLRLASTYGPRGRSIDKHDDLPFFPVANDKWCKQYVHEDDVTDVIAMFTFADFVKQNTFEILNLAATDLILASEVAKILHKSLITLPPLVINFIFFLLWHLSRGKIPTSRGSWRLFCYPILIDGSKITKKFGFDYLYTSRESVASEDGRYGRDVI
ncbi:MAG: NAD-dependent epimerase/dehydratase family protein [Candidatus Vogelbacteria bacterium]|nr:NAD-dependent epimerase/dehydratase family protein [Candidatus Vogelbacteria bacterium]